MTAGAPRASAASPVIRVALPYPRDGSGWLGGLNYLRNLTTALVANPDLGVEPVLLLRGRGHPDEGFASVARVASPLLSIHGWLADRGAWHRLNADPLLDALLGSRNIAVLSHANPLGPRARTPVIGWIPDFQHRHLPHFFSARERALRDAVFERTCRLTASVVVSSAAARDDLATFYPAWAAKARVVRFVDSSVRGGSTTGRRDLEKRYGFEGPFLLLPNQFWIHKNHRVVVEALGILARGGRRPLVLATGHTQDFRAPGFHAELMARANELRVEASFRVLGSVPFGDLTALMDHAAAIINPSLFEGWSTTVEEGKSRGKRVLLSDIPVHREQAPARGIYFDPHDPDRLAELIWAVWREDDPALDARAAEEAAAQLPARRRSFAEAYAAVVREVAGG